jgi:hypothetical protein
MANENIDFDEVDTDENHYTKIIQHMPINEVITFFKQNPDMAKETFQQMWSNQEILKNVKELNKKVNDNYPATFQELTNTVNQISDEIDTQENTQTDLP